ncbi:MAG: DUF4091 domain-containing protein [Clostridiales bacterium]|nr:DUF4091 domain-containing protein [Candidatus Equinaster intestinalis]
MLKILQLSSLEKVLPDADYSAKEFKKITVLCGESLSFQVAYRDDTFCKHEFSYRCSAKCDIKLYDVINVPVGMATNPYSMEDTNYITHTSRLVPDWLHEKETNFLDAANYYKALWFEFGGFKKAGDYTLTVDFKKIEKISPYTVEEKTEKSIVFNIKVLPAVLPEQKLIFTQWFHTDCISSYYGVETFSERHWELIESFMKEARHEGISLIYTPIFTPPLDTAVGGERPTVQLTDIYYKDGKYSFNFDKLHRYIKLAKKMGFKYFEMAHLFTQWGAKFTPKIMVQTEKGLKRFFGWDVSATSAKYKKFLAAFLPALIEELKAEKILKNTYFHISDEPLEEHLESYLAAKNVVLPYLKCLNMVDAASKYEFYERGLFPEPIISTDHIKPFLEHKVKDLWAYYCCCETTGKSNRLISMPSYRTRFLAYQLFKYDIKGFLHWGFNFYYSQCSKRKINPFTETDAGGSFPSGDPFTVYPGVNGAEPSLRLIVFKECLQDLQAMQLLESYIGREKVIKLIEKVCGEEIVFEHCAENAQTIYKLREKINAEIMKYSK